MYAVVCRRRQSLTHPQSHRGHLFFASVESCSGLTLHDHSLRSTFFRRECALRRLGEHVFDFPSLILALRNGRREMGVRWHSLNGWLISFGHFFQSSSIFPAESRRKSSSRGWSSTRRGYPSLLELRLQQGSVMSAPVLRLPLVVDIAERHRRCSETHALGRVNGVCLLERAEC